MPGAVAGEGEDEGLPVDTFSLAPHPRRPHAHRAQREVAHPAQRQTHAQRLCERESEHARDKLAARRHVLELHITDEKRDH